MIVLRVQHDLLMAIGFYFCFASIWISQVHNAHRTNRTNRTIFIKRFKSRCASTYAIDIISIWICIAAIPNWTPHRDASPIQWAKLTIMKSLVMMTRALFFFSIEIISNGFNRFNGTVVGIYRSRSYLYRLIWLILDWPVIIDYLNAITCNLLLEKSESNTVTMEQFKF